MVPVFKRVAVVALPGLVVSALVGFLVFDIATDSGVNAKHLPARLPAPASGKAMAYQLDFPTSKDNRDWEDCATGGRMVLLPDGGAVLSVPVYSSDVAGPEGGPEPSSHDLCYLSPQGKLDVVGSADHPVLAPSGQVYVQRDDKTLGVLDLAVGTVRDAPFPEPASTGFPFAVEADGTVLTVDPDTGKLWSVTAGGAKPLMTVKGVAEAVVDHRGAVYVQPAAGYETPDTTTTTTDPPLKDLLAADPAKGTSTPIPLPASIPGVPQRPTDLTVLRMTGADDGVYVLAEPSGAGDPAARYVLHLHDGTADLVAAQAGSGAVGEDACSFSGAIDATKLPCLPTKDDAVLAYTDGRLLVSGEGSAYSGDVELVIGVRG